MHVCRWNQAIFIASGWVDLKSPDSLFSLHLCSLFHVVTSAKGRINEALSLKKDRSSQISKRGGDWRTRLCWVTGGLNNSHSGESSAFLGDNIWKAMQRGEAAVGFCAGGLFFFFFFYKTKQKTQLVAPDHSWWFTILTFGRLKFFELVISEILSWSHAARQGSCQLDGRRLPRLSIKVSMPQLLTRTSPTLPRKYKISSADCIFQFWAENNCRIIMDAHEIPSNWLSDVSRLRRVTQRATISLVCPCVF